jgi:hypothetical protein
MGGQTSNTLSYRLYCSNASDAGHSRKGRFPLHGPVTRLFSQSFTTCFRKISQIERFSSSHSVTNGLKGGFSQGKGRSFATPAADVPSPNDSAADLTNHLLSYQDRAGYGGRRASNS